MRQYRFGGFGGLSPVVKNLLIINVLAFLLYQILLAISQGSTDLNNILGLHYFASQAFSPYQYVSYMFMHGGFMHLFFNMFALWMFGNILEGVFGGKRFLVYYMVTGIGAALVHSVVMYFEVSEVVNNIDAFMAQPTLEALNIFIEGHKFRVDALYTPEIWADFKSFESNYTLWSLDPQSAIAKAGAIEFMSIYREHFMSMPIVVGASGAVFGILLAFGMLFPNVTIYIYFAIPIKAKYFVILYGLAELWFAFADNPDDNVAHFAHLGGMLFGIFLILFWKKYPPKF